MNFLHKTLFRTSKSNIFLLSIPPILHHPFSLSSPYSTKLHYNDPETQILSPAKDKKLARPSEIPYQPKVVNWVNLVGTVTMPIKFCTSVDGKTWAGTIISHQRHSFAALPSLRIPIVFEGDLAVTAATHLKKNDNVHVAGHLSSDTLPINMTNQQVKVQVMVHNVYYVRQFFSMKNCHPRS